MQKQIEYQKSWSKSTRSASIELYKKSHNNTLPFLFIGGMHGDEPEGVQLAKDFLQWLQVAEAENRVKRSWILIPCINIDGYKKNERTNGRGVDLNRNFPTQDWTSEHKAPRYYPGPAPASEPETQALVEIINVENPVAIIHFHSWEPCIVYTGHSGKKLAELFTLGNGYKAREDIGYPTPGSLGQYGWFEKNIPVICIEESNQASLDQVWGHFNQGLQKLMTTEEHFI